MTQLFYLDAIERSLHRFRREFPAINNDLSMRREEFTGVMVDRIIEAYDFLNSLLIKDMNLFTPVGLYALLEMNHIVLCGRDRETRLQYFQHVNETRKSFQLRITPIKTWVIRNQDTENPYMLAAGFYSRMLARPQLFLEGNHRTGNILLNYLLISRNAFPYIIAPEHARRYLDVSGDIKFTDKEHTLDTALRMPGHRRRFQSFLQTHSSGEFVTSRGRSW